MRFPLAPAACSLLIASGLMLRAANSPLPPIAAPVSTAVKPAVSASTTPPLPSVTQIAITSSATVPAVTLDPKKHESFVELAKKGNIDALFLGDSITDWWRESDPATRHNGKAVFDKYFGDLKVANFGIAGEGTQHVLWRLRNGEGAGFSPKVIMLMIGTNNLRGNTDEQIAIGIATVVAELRKDFPAARVLLLGVFPRGPAADQARGRIARINQTIAGLNDLNHVFYMDIGNKFLARDGNIPTDVMGDLLHPTPKGYEIWAEAVKEPLANLLKLPPLTPAK